MKNSRLMASLSGDVEKTSVSPKGLFRGRAEFRRCSGRLDLEKERRQGSFDTRQMNYYIHGGKDIVEVEACSAIFSPKINSFVKK